MKINLHRTDTPYKITKSSIQERYSYDLPKFGSFNKSKKTSERMSNKKRYELFILQYLTSFGLLTKGGLCVFAKKTKSKEKTKYFTVEVLSQPNKKISYTLDGVSDSAMGIAIRLAKLGANSFYYSVPFNQNTLPKSLQASSFANTVLSFFNMFTSCGDSKVFITYFEDAKNFKDVKPAFLSIKKGKITIFRKEKKPLQMKNKEKALQWLLKHLNSYDIPIGCVYSKSGLKTILELSKKAELSSIETTKLAIWEGKDRRNNFSQAFQRQTSVYTSTEDNKDYLSTTKSGKYFEGVLKKFKPMPTILFLSFKVR